MEEGKEKKSQVALDEERVLDFWQKNKIFEKSLAKPSPQGEFVFYDGPPFATGLPHYGHILAGTMKDVIPRYKTMCGYHVDRNWGWDCHGLPIENLIQKEHDLKTKADIENFGIKKFNQAAKASVFMYDKEWRQIVPRTGRWVDMDNQYTTMDPNFMESVWWGFNEIYKKGLVYENFRSMHISPALETTLSNFEVGLNYKDITDISVYVRFELEDDPGTYLIAWTTTPWTLFGNVALAVGSDITYSKIEIENSSAEGKIKHEKIIVAKDLAEKILKDKKYTIIEDIKGDALIGKSYKPVFDHYSKNEKLENRENGWKIYPADFVTTEDGTGIVHIAPAFGEDDLILGQEKNLPFVQHVNIDGSIKPEIEGFAGLQAKPKNDPTETDVLVLKKLATDGKLFEKQKYTHSYPFCWRTDTPLLNYAMSSWFIKVTDYNKKMVQLNEKIRWVPENVGSKRFGNWLTNVRDWGISRSRYWGTPIPIWKSEDESEIEVLGSIADIKKWTKSSNKYFLMRHGEADHNVKRFLAGTNKTLSHLTDKGKEQIKNNAKKLMGEKIDLVFVSPLMRTQETAEILKKELGLKDEQFITDDRIKEVQGGILEGKSGEEYGKFYNSVIEKFEKAPEDGETLVDIRKRVGDFIYEINRKYQNKKILIITHEYPIWMFTALKEGLDNKQSANLKTFGQDFVPTGDFAEYDFAELPHDDDYILDLHRPYIDEITFTKNGKKMHRIKDVFDGWVDSGSMPYAVAHYPFEKNIDPTGGVFKKTKGFPADFIAEGLDQTRGWFYTLLALSTPLFGKSPFKNVIVNGLALAEDGQKMSKSLRNYPDPTLIFNKYSADAMRYYLLSSQIVEAEPLNFSEKGVDEVSKKIIGRLLNVVSFYELYAKNTEIKNPNSENILDKWIVTRLGQVLQETTDAMERYELNNACRPFNDFVNDLSTWYLRRSRDRVKGDDEKDKNNALETLAYVLYEFSKILAPFMPFLAENIYQRISGNNLKNVEDSVHLLDWSKSENIDQDILLKMEKVREIVSLGLEARDKANIKVRQPLSVLKTKEYLPEEFTYLIKEEVNVKQILSGQNFDNPEERVILDTNITNELKQEGISREIIRFVQTLRKEMNLNTDDKIKISISINNDLKEGVGLAKEILDKFKGDIKKITNATEIIWQDNDGQELKEGDFVFKISVSKI